MLGFLTLLLCCQLAGELIVLVSGLPLPGPVLGTARAMQVNEVAGAFAGLAMGLNALATAILLPLLWRWLM